MGLGANAVAALLLVASLALTPAAAEEPRPCDTPAAIHFRGAATCDEPAADEPAIPEAVLEGANADGTLWRVTYHPPLYASEEDALRHAQMTLDAALEAYARLTSWGFASRDPDGVLDVRMDGCACILGADDALIRVFPRANDTLAFLPPGIAYASEEELARVILHHELFHHMQYGVQRWALGMWLVEGMARFTETLSMPDAADTPTSLAFAGGALGMNGFMAAPERTITQHSYDWALAWGWLYAHEGGMPFLVAALEESANATGDPNVAGPAAIQRAMDRAPGGEHATFEEAWAAFARSLVTREGFAWGAPGEPARDWAPRLQPVARSDAAAGEAQLLAWGIRVHEARPANAAGAVAVSFAGAPLYDASLVTSAGAMPVAGSAAASGVEDAALVVARTVYLDPGGVNAVGHYAFAVAR